MVGRSFKRCLRTALGNARLTFDEFLTVLIEVEATLNSRPLTYEYSNPTVKDVLALAHLIYGRRITTLPELQDDEEEKVGITRRYKSGA